MKTDYLGTFFGCFFGQLLNDGKIVEVPSGKSEFFALFGKDAKNVKAYMQKNKIGIKKLEDLKKVVVFLNSWSDQIQKG